jgi:hypothetical protein
VLFARRYLTWNASAPQQSAQALAPFSGSGVEPDAGLQLPTVGQERVAWAEVVQARAPWPGEHVYTVAAQTDSSGLLYLSVSVARTRAGTLALAAYPAFVGAPAAGPAQTPQHLREASDPALTRVVERALRNYLAGSASELAADLANGALVSLPTMPLTLDSLLRLDWSTDGRSLLAVVQAQDGRDVQYTLSYELDVAIVQGRWEVSAVQMNPAE